MTRSLLRVLLLGLVGVGCAPSADVAGSSGGSDVDRDADADLTRAVLATVSEDYAVGALATVNLDDWTVRDGITDLTADPVVVSSGGYVFQINRLSYDTIRVYEPGAWSAPVAEFALADLANPQDVEVCAGKAFVSQYGRDQVAVYDHTTGLRSGSVDLSAYDDGDGTPEASELVLAANGRLYLSYENLDRDGGWVSVGGGVVEIDCEAEAVTNQWDFTDASVFAYTSDPTQVVVAEGGVGLHLLDTETGSARQVLDAAALPESLIGFADHEGQAVVLFSDADYNYGVGCIDTDDWTFELAEALDNYAPALAGNALGEAWITARTHWSNPAADNGALVYDIATCRPLTTGGPISTTLAPISIAFY